MVKHIKAWFLHHHLEFKLCTVLNHNWTHRLARSSDNQMIENQLRIKNSVATGEHLVLLVRSCLTMSNHGMFSQLHRIFQWAVNSHSYVHRTLPFKDLESVTTKEYLRLGRQFPICIMILTGIWVNNPAVRSTMSKVQARWICSLRQFSSLLFPALHHLSVHDYYRVIHFTRLIRLLHSLTACVSCPSHQVMQHHKLIILDLHLCPLLVNCHIRKFMYLLSYLSSWQCRHLK